MSNPQVSALYNAHWPMTKTITITRDEARLLLLHQQGLLTPPTRPARKADVLGAIRRMRVLQIDTIHVVARSPYLTLFSRLGSYPPRWLDELHAAGKLFEYWAHAACFIPREDWPLYRGLILASRRVPSGASWLRVHAWLKEHRREADAIRRAISEGGPVKSADFPAEQPGGGGWWNWKVEKEALECLFYAGELMIARREGFQRVYDLTARVRPDWDDRNALPADVARQAQLRQAALALGAATEAWLRDYFHLKQATARPALQALVADGELLPVELEGVGAAYLHRDLLPLLRKVRRDKLVATHTALLTPFDPLVWDRKRAAALFGFDYQIECYTPEPKRRYGYFTLPVLHRGRLIGRLDPKAHRQDGVFEIKSFHLEPGVDLSAQDIAEVTAAIQACADWHGTPRVVVRRSDPAGLKAKLREHGFGVGAAQKLKP